MSRDGVERAGEGEVFATANAAGLGRPMSIEDRRRHVAESLRVGNPTNNARDLPRDADPRHECRVELYVEDIHPYEHNPRRTSNEKFAEILASIAAVGIRTPLTVTRRPGEEHFIVESGGNTRLLAVQKLWAETRDPRFEKLNVVFRPWCSESQVLAAHLIENEQRGDMTFWDKANGVMALRRQLEAELGHALGLRPLEGALKSRGLTVHRATLAYYAFATRWLRTLGDAVPVLSGLDIRKIEPCLNRLTRLAASRIEASEQDLYERVFEPVFETHAAGYRKTRTFSAASLCRDCEHALATDLGELRPERYENAPGMPSSESAVGQGTNAVVRAFAQNEKPSAEESNASGIPVHSTDTRACDFPGRRFQECISRVAELAGLTDCLCLGAEPKSGFSLTSSDSGSDGGGKRAWGLLATVGAVMRGEELASPKRASSAGDAQPHDAIVLWLLDPSDEAASLALEIIALAREHRRAALTACGNQRVAGGM